MNSSPGHALVEFRAVSKAFGGTQALHDVSFPISTGEIHALVGENGAGKSTLIKILGGVFSPDTGTVLLGGEDIRFRNTHQSQESGISVIYQEFNLLPDLTVAENVFIGREARKFLFLDWSTMRQQTERVLESLGVPLDPMTRVEDLTVAQKQMVEIAKALTIDARLIVMDEPTAALSEQETEKLFEVVRTLKRQDKTILFVSHRLHEVFALCEHVTVLRDGRFVASRAIEELDERAVVRLMVGRDIEAATARKAAPVESALLSVRGLSVKGLLHEVSCDVGKGKILAVTGLMGSGRSELLEALYGLWPLDAGEVSIAGERKFVRSPREAIAEGIGFLCEDRKAAGLFPGLSVLQNLSISVIKGLTRWGGLIVSAAQERRLLDGYTSKLSIRHTGSDQHIEFLSGGNQQKILLARALAADCRLLLLGEPTRGVDVGAKSEIHRIIHELAETGVTILMSSSDLSEVISMGDSCLVMRQGRVAAHLHKDEMTQTRIVACAAGHAGASMGSTT